MIKNKGKRLYTGVTDSPERRLVEHNNKKGANFTKNNPSFEIVFLEEYSYYKQARLREIQIKKWSRGKKEILIKRYLQGLKTKLWFL